MTMIIGRGHEPVLPRAVADARGTLRRIADLETVIERQSSARHTLSAQGLSTRDMDRIIDILVCSLQLLRGYQAAIEDEGLDGMAIASANPGPLS
jgi:hypothetical protein